MRNKNRVLIEQLDQKLHKFEAARTVIVPDKGWIHTIRTSINMTMEQLAKKIGLSKGAIQKIEEREATGQLSIKKLKRVGDALEMQLVYGFVPKAGTLDDLINLKAEKLARRIVMRTNQTMKLENQGISQNKIDKSIMDLANEIKREMRKSLWD